LVSHLAEAEGMPQGLKIVNKTDTILYDSAWMAGVDYDQAIQNNKDQESQESQDKNYDKMHPDVIVGLAQDKQQKNLNQNQENNDQEQEPLIEQEQLIEQKQLIEEEKEEEEEIVFEEEDSEEINPKEEIFNEVKTTRSGRASRQVHKYVTMHHAHLQTQAIDPQEYNINNAKVIAQTINKMNMQFAQTYSLAIGIKAFGADGHPAAHEKMKQLHNRVVFIPLLVEELTQIEKRRAMESLIFLTEKKDGKIKAKMCANRST
jgi:hypothetical protein